MMRSRGGPIVRVLTLVAALAAFTVVTAPSSADGAAAAATPWTSVDLRGYRYGRLAVPDATPAVAGPKLAGFSTPSQGASFGPWAFDVAPGGGVWLLDPVNNRLLTWPTGSGTAPRIVKLPYRSPVDLAIAADGTVYVSFKPDRYRLYALTPGGSTRWWTSLSALDAGSHGYRIFNSVLRFGPDATLYEVGEFATAPALWTPLVSPSGSPLSPDRQWSQRLSAQPMPGGLVLHEQLAEHGDWKFWLADRAGRVVRGVTLTGTSRLGTVIGATPALRGGNLMLAVTMLREDSGTAPYEVLALQVPVNGGAVQRLSLDARAPFGDVITPLRFGDGVVYQLQSSPSTGAKVVRYRFGGTVTPTTTTASSGGATSTPATTLAGTSLTAPATSVTAPATAAPTVTAATPTAAPGDGGGSTGSGSPMLWWVAGAVAAAAAATGAAAWSGHRRRSG
jgi:hypothetical protein